MRKTSILLTSLLLTIILLGYQLYFSMQSHTPETGNSCSVLLIIEHRDCEGNLLERRVKNGDLILENFGRLWLAIMRGGAEYKDIFKLRGTGGAWNYPFYKGITQDTKIALDEEKSYIVLGSGTASATLEDYQMANQIMEAQVGSIGVSVIGNKINATISTTFTFDGSYTIREIGLKGKINSYSYGDYAFFVCRDDISSNPITVENGDILTVTYVFMLN